MQDVFVDYIKQERERGKTILLSSHIFSEVDATCERIAIIKDGKIVSEFLADDLKHASQKRYLIEFQTQKECNRFCEAARGSDVFALSDVDGKTVRVTTEDSRINGAVTMLAEYGVVNFKHEQETLEDYFMSYYKEDKNFKGALVQ